MNRPGKSIRFSIGVLLMFNNTVRKIKQFTGDGVIPPLSRDQIFSNENGSVQIKTTFINTFSFPIVVVLRNGIRHTVQPSAYGSVNPSFIVRQHITVFMSGWPDMDKFISALPINGYEFLKRFGQIWIEQKLKNVSYPMGGNMSRTIVVDYPVNVQDFYECSAMYHRAGDVVLSRLDLLQSPPHPFHPDAAGFVKTNIDQIDTEANHTLIQLELIQEEKALSARYISVSNKVFTIFPKTDLKKKEGVYITYSEVDPLDESKMRAVQEFYTLEEAEKKLGVHKTPEEALSAGDINAARKQELAKLEHDNHVMKREFETFKLSEAEKTSAREREIQELEHKNKLRIHELTVAKDEAEFNRKIAEENFARLRMETKFISDKQMLELKDYAEQKSLGRRDYYEERSSARKDSTDMIKAIPALIASVGGFFLLISKTTAT